MAEQRRPDRMVTDLERFALEQVMRPYWPNHPKFPGLVTVTTLRETPPRYGDTLWHSLDEVVADLIAYPEWAGLVWGRNRRCGWWVADYVQHPLAEMIRSGGRLSVEHARHAMYDTLASLHAPYGARGWEDDRASADWSADLISMMVRATPRAYRPTSGLLERDSVLALLDKMQQNSQLSHHADAVMEMRRQVQRLMVFAP